MVQTNGNGERAPIGAARNGLSGASVTWQTLLILLALERWFGFSTAPEHLQHTLAIAAAIAGGWGFVAGVIARVARDELHAMKHGEVRHGVLVRLVLELASLLG